MLKVQRCEQLQQQIMGDTAVGIAQGTPVGSGGKEHQAMSRSRCCSRMVSQSHVKDISMSHLNIPCWMGQQYLIATALKCIN